MSVKTLSFRADESDIEEIRKAASESGISVAGLLRKAVKEYIGRMAFFRRLENIEEASPEESAEILEMINNMTDDDWETASVHHVYFDSRNDRNRSKNSRD